MDQKLLLLINRVWTSPGLDRFMAMLSSFDLWWPVLLALLLVGLWRGSFRVRAFLLVAALSVALSDGVVCRTLKREVNRPRPAQAQPGVREVELGRARLRLLALGSPLRVRINAFARQGGEGRSFPSSHVANVFAAAWVGLLFFPRRAWWALVVAAGVGWSRVYTGSHWPSDVVASVFLGTGVGVLTAVGAEWLWQAGGRRWLPAGFPAPSSLLPV